MAISVPTSKINLTISKSVSLSKRRFQQGVFCVTFEQVAHQGPESNILCEPCNGRGWVLCDFCLGKKTNVKSESKRIYRRCPTCKAIGYLMCSKCKVYKCITYPNCNDGELL